MPHIDFFTDKRKSGGPSDAFCSILLLLTVLLALGGAAPSFSSFGCGCGINGGHIKSLLAAAAAAAHAKLSMAFVVVVVVAVGVAMIITCIAV